VELVGLRELLQASDVVSVHVALSAETHQLMGEDQFALMKPGSYFINTSRGGVVDERALEDALRAGRLAGAALDVFETEPLPADSGLRWLPNVILTPHMVGHSRELLEAIPRVAFENVVRILHGRTPLYVQNPRVLEAWGRRLQRLPP
jgi:D-3-phosphoglycerate dehydrogenase